MVVEKSAVIKFDKHVASRIFSPDELESLDSYMQKYRKYGIVELLDAKLDGVCVSTAGAGVASASYKAQRAAAAKDADKAQGDGSVEDAKEDGKSDAAKTDAKEGAAK